MELTVKKREELRSNKVKQLRKKFLEPSSGELTFQLRWLPFVTLRLNDDENPCIAVLTIFIYSCNNLTKFIDGSKLSENESIPEENQLKVLNVS